MATADAEFEHSADSVLSADGTRIAYLTVGQGPPVLVVPGALSVASGFARFAAALGKDFTVHTMERRGRGASGPQGSEYRITEDCADIRALQRKTGAALIVGHSYGGLIALEAARTNPDIRKLALYEPGVSIAGSVPSDWMRPYEKYLDQGKPFDAFIEFVRAMGPEGMQKVPRWMFRRMMPMFMDAPERDMVVSQLAENLREHREIIRLDDTYPNYAGITAQVLLMDGDKDRQHRTDPDHTQLAKTLPHCERHTVPGLDHFGIDKQAPELVAGIIGEFFSRS
ncbi:alpha/beta fold hydrolase [Nocardia sp. SYP-A9097]|uniref:alpha/beta fold hydrolase n=1 Tax=Nocardia sp. SYP-A9097 TaxID=2663237 RepID=UPI00129BC65A|nr:alpha/beta hydrolase [Nocardia sp. SYP-A9097]MRH88430.1 alpha/beta fold hydrolase [Nocardia sp. SYP-A9097]